MAWNEIYKGIVLEWFLKELEKSSKKTYDEFDIINNNQFILEVDNEVVGVGGVPTSTLNEIRYIIIRYYY